jgi:hypothetical protein
MVHWHINIRWQNSPETSEAASLDAASVPEKKTQWPNRSEMKILIAFWRIFDKLWAEFLYSI